MGTSVEVPTGLRIRTRYWVRHSWDVDQPLAAFERFRRAHPELEIEDEATIIRADLHRLRLRLASREFDDLIDASWPLEYDDHR